MNKRADFDEWMSGRYWLGDKAPAEGFYGRYKQDDLDLMRIAFDFGAAGGWNLNFHMPSKVCDENTKYNIEWSYWCGTYFTSRLNEKSE